MNPRNNFGADMKDVEMIWDEGLLEDVLCTRLSHKPTPSYQNAPYIIGQDVAVDFSIFFGL